MLRLTATNAINEVAPEINGAINRKPEVEADGGAREQGEERGAGTEVKSANRRRREDYNAYMRGYMKRRRASSS